MEQLNKSNETMSQLPDSNGWSDFPPFMGDNVEQPSNFTEMTDLEEIHNLELDIVAKNSDVLGYNVDKILGYNIDSKSIIWPERQAQAVRAKEFLKSGGDVETLSKQYQQPVKRVLEAIDEELLKDSLLDDTLSKLPEGTKFRINPHAPQSAFSVANSEKVLDENGEISFRINSDTMTQIRKIKEKANESELTVVMNQFHIGEDGKPNSNIPTDSNDYISLCRSFIEQSGYSQQSGKGLILELGNECNMSHESNGPLFKSEAFAEKTDPEAYAKFYFETAKALKSTFPDIKLSLAGTAFYDYDFTKQAIDQIQAAKDKDESLKDIKLIDIVSFHPYRKTVESPTVFLSNGKELSGPEIEKKAVEYWKSLDDNKKSIMRQTVLANLTESEKAVADSLSNEEVESAIARKVYNTFDCQLESLRKLANQVGAEVTVGEISFYAGEWGVSVNENEQERNAIYGREKGYMSFLWPGEQIVKYENPKQRRMGLDA